MKNKYILYLNEIANANYSLKQFKEGDVGITDQVVELTEEDFYDFGVIKYMWEQWQEKLYLLSCDEVARNLVNNYSVDKEQGKFDYLDTTG